MRGIIAVDRVLAVALVSALLAVGSYYALADAQVRNTLLSGMAVTATGLLTHAMQGDVIAIAILGAIVGIAIYALHTFRDIVYTALLILILVGSIQGALALTSGALHR